MEFRNTRLKEKEARIGPSLKKLLRNTGTNMALEMALGSVQWPLDPETLGSVPVATYIFVHDNLQVLVVHGHTLLHKPRI